MLEEGLAARVRLNEGSLEHVNVNRLVLNLARHTAESKINHVERAQISLANDLACSWLFQLIPLKINLVRRSYHHV